MLINLRSPLTWFGGKGHMLSKLLKYVPPHKIYVEVFGGGASLLFAKYPSDIEVYNDIHSDLVNFFRVIRDEEKFKKFYKLVYLTPYSREEFCDCRKTYKDCSDDVERAYKWYIIVRQSFSGQEAHSWRYIVNTSTRGMAQTASSWLSTIELLPQIHQRLMRVQIEHDDFRKIIPRYDTENTFFYLDPPYLPETRKSGKYKNDMSYKDHEELVEILKNIKGKVMLSGYDNSLYEVLGWEKIGFETACMAVARTRQTGILGKGSAKEKHPRTEYIWINYRKNNSLFLNAS